MLFLSSCCTILSSWSRDGCKAPGISSSQAEANHRKGSHLSHSWTTFSFVHWSELDRSQTMSFNQWAWPNWLQPMKLPQLTLHISSVDYLKEVRSRNSFWRGNSRVCQSDLTFIFSLKICSRSHSRKQEFRRDLVSAFSLPGGTVSSLYFITPLSPYTSWCHRCIIYPFTHSPSLLIRQICAGSQRTVCQVYSLRFSRWLLSWPLS